MSSMRESTGTEILITRTAVYAYKLARRVRLQPAEISSADLDQLQFLEQVVRLDEVVQRAIDAAPSGKTSKEHAEHRLIGEISSLAVSAADLCQSRTLDSFDQTELSNALFSLGQAVGHVEVVHGPLGRLGAELVEKRIKKNSDTAKNNAARSAWQDTAIEIFDRLSQERPDVSKEELRAKAIAELKWPEVKGKGPPNTEALRKAIAKRKTPSA